MGPVDLDQLPAKGCENPLMNMKLPACLLTALVLCSSSLIAVAQDDADRPRLGVTVALDSDEGLRVDGVRAGSPAEKAGIKAGDVLVAVNGKKVGTDGDLVGVLDQLKFGSTVDVTVLRDGKEVPLKVTFPPREDGDPKACLARLTRIFEGKPTKEQLAEAKAEIEKLKAIVEKLQSHETSKAPAAKPAHEPSGDDDDRPNPGHVDPQKISARVSELLSEGSSISEVKKIIAKEFPGVMIQIKTSAGGDEDDDEGEDAPVAKPASRPAADSRPATDSKPSK